MNGVPPDEAQDRPRPSGGRLALAVLALLVGLAYANSFSVAFVFDDLPIIVENPLIRDLRLFWQPGFAGDTAASPAAAYAQRSRYVAMLSFALNYRARGLAVEGYHAVNLAVHLAAGLLLYALLLQLLGSPPLAGSSLTTSRYPVAWLAAAFFLLHPVQTQAVTYVVQRMASLAGMLCLLSLVAYAEWRRDAAPAPARAAWYALSVVALVAAMNTKQSAASFPLVLVLYELVFCRGPLLRRLAGLTPHVITMLIVPWSLLRAAGAGPLALDAVVGAAGAGPEVSSSEYLATQARVVLTYLRLLVLPVGQNLDYDYTIYRSFLDPPVLLAGAVLALLGLAAVRLMLRPPSGEPAWRLVGFGVAWFFTALAVESSIFPIADVINEHRLYLPSAGAFAAAVVGGALLLAPARRRAAFAVAVGIAVAFGVATHARNRAWRSPETIWGDAASKSPHKARPLSNMGVVHELRGELDAALAWYRRAVEANPRHFEAVYNLASLHARRGERVAAVERFLEAGRLRPREALVHQGLLKALEALSKDAGVEARADAAAPVGLRERVASLHETGRSHLALLESAAALASAPRSGGLWNNLGNAYRRAGWGDLAIVCARRAVALLPEDAVARNGLGVALKAAGKIPEAVVAYRQAIALEPGYGEAHFNLANALMALDQPRLALPEYETAAALLPGNPIITGALARARGSAGR